MLLDKPLTLIISGRNTRDMDDKDLDNLLASYSLAEKAKESFLSQEITFDEYLQLLEQHQINIDSYLECIESNLHTQGLI
ncbi:MAG: hypothetical protein ACFCU5_20910 [Pleurocapsa sp.]